MLVKGGGACTLWKDSVLSKGAQSGPARAKLEQSNSHNEKNL